jgi:hypothetical protein
MFDEAACFPLTIIMITSLILVTNANNHKRKAEGDYVLKREGNYHSLFGGADNF